MLVLRLAVLAGVAFVARTCARVQRDLEAVKDETAAIEAGPTSIDDWLDEIERPGFRLLLESDTTAGWYFAVYATEDGRLACCRKHRGKLTGVRQSSLKVLDLSGESLLDTGPGTIEPLTRHLKLGGETISMGYHVSDGDVYPMRDGYEGPMKVAFREGPGGATATAVVFEATIDWPARGR